MTKFILFSVLCAVVYGIVHDLVTAHVAVTYFTVHHPHIINSESPIALALVWGILATWWVGLPLGALIGAANTIGNRPQLPWNRIRKRLIILLLVAFVGAMLALASIYLLADQIPMHQRGPTFEQDRRLVAVAIAHEWSYFAGAATGIGLAAWTWLARRRLRES